MNCPNCQTANPESARFCFNCGASLAPVPAPSGERRLVTVLFADVVGSTAMGDHLDPEIVTEIMNGAFAFMNDAIGRYDGTVARLMGDAVMAFFGAPLAHENDPERAVRAALEIRSSANAYQRLVQEQYGVDFVVRIGVNTGLAVVATVGDSLRSEHTVMGDTVNVASRLQHAAEPGTVLISGETLRHVRHVVDFEPKGSMQLRGKLEPVDTYLVSGLRATPGQARGLVGIRSPLIGRNRELAELKSRVGDLRAGHGSLVVVVGEAGLGKSRLVAELRASVTSDEHDVGWIEGRALALASSTPYYPWREIMYQIIGASALDSVTEVRAKLEAHAAETGIAPERLPYLQAILSIENPDVSSPLDTIDGNLLRSALAAATQDLVAATVSLTPLVLVLDDLHWADNGTLELLSAVSDLVRTRPLLVVAVLRPDRSAPSHEFAASVVERLADRSVEIRLDPLDSEHAGELLSSLLQIEDLPDSIRDMILNRSEGNPFFLEEVIRTLIDGGHIVYESGHWRARKEIAALYVPETLVGVLSARIDRLPEETRHVAQIASVIGRVFTYPVISAMCEASPLADRIPDPLPHLIRLIEEELVRERAREPEKEFIFKHALTQEAAYSQMLVRVRREYHKYAGEVLEQMFADRIDENAATLAHHFWIAEDWPRVIEYSLRAGNRAERQLYALHEAHLHFERALQAVDQHEGASEQQVVEAILAGMTGATKFLSREAVLERLDRAEQITRRSGDRRNLARVLHWIAHVHATSGFISRGVPALMENAELAAELEDPFLTLYPSWMMSLQMLDSDPAIAADQLDEIGRHAEMARIDFLQVHGFAGAAVGYARVGQFQRARHYLDRARAVAERTDDPVAAADFYLASSIAYFAMGELERGIEQGRIGIDKSLESKAMECAATGFCLVGMGNFYNQRPDDALSTFERSLEFADQYRGDPLVVNQVDSGMALARHATGRTDSLQEIERARTSSQALGDAFTLADISMVLADAYARQGDFALACDHIEQAIEYYRRTNMRPYLHRALEAYAEILEMQGNLEALEDVRQRASEIAGELRQIAEEEEAEFSARV